MKKKRAARNRTVIQNHHIRYKGVPRFPGDSTEEWIETVFKGEHRILFLIGLRKRFSLGFLVSLREELRRIEKNAADLSNLSRLKKK